MKKVNVSKKRVLFIIMEELTIINTKFTPRVITNAGIIEFSGVSITDDATAFYSPILKWIEDYMDEGGDVRFVMKLYYLNSSSVHCVKKIISKANQMGNIEVEWHYELDDEGMEMTAQSLSEATEVEFKMIKCDVL